MQTENKMWKRCTNCPQGEYSPCVGDFETMKYTQEEIQDDIIKAVRLLYIID